MSSEGKNTKTPNPLRVVITTKPPVYLTSERAQILIQIISDDVISVALHGENSVQLKSNPMLCNGFIITEFYNEASLLIIKHRFRGSGVQNPLKQIIFADVANHSIEFISDFDPVQCVKCSLRIDYPASGWKINMILMKQNEEYQMDQWYYYDAIKSKNNSTVTYYVPQNILVKVQDANCQVTFGFQTVELQIIESGNVHVIGVGRT